MSISRFDLGDLTPSLENGDSILVPNLRLQDALLESYAALKGNRPHRTPKVMPVDLWIQAQIELLASQGIQPFCEISALSPNEEQALWQLLIERSLERFPLLNPVDTAYLVSQSYRDMRQWQLSARVMGASPGESEQAADWIAFQTWCRAFEAHCREYKLSTLVDSLSTLSDWLQEGKNASLFRELADDQRLLLVDFDEPPPLYQHLFELLAQQFPMQRHQTLSDSFDRPPPQLVGYTDIVQEAEACIDWVEQFAAAKADTHIGILLPDKGDNVAALDRARHERHWHTRSDLEVSDWCNRTQSPQQLDQTGLGQDAWLILRSLFMDSSIEQLSRLLCSPYLMAFAQEQDSRAAAQWVLRDRLGPALSLSEWSAPLQQQDQANHCPLLSQILLEARGLIRQHPKQQNASGWSDLFTQLWELLIDRRSFVNRQEPLVWETLQSCLEQLAECYEAYGSCTARVALSWLQLLISRAAVAPGYSAKRQVSLYTVQEAQGLRFDALWFFGFDDLKWPQAPKPSPFIPPALQREVGLPGATADSQLQLAARQTRLLIAHCSGPVRVSYAINAGDQQQRPSTLFGVDAEAAATHAAGNDYDSSVLTEIPDTPPEAVTELEQIRSGQALFSDQSNCPYRAFARHRLGLRELPSPETGLSPALRGTAVHIALETFYRDIEDLNELCNYSEADLQQRASQASEAAISFLGKAQPRLLAPKFKELEQRRIEAVLLLYIELDKEREPFRVLALEKRLSWTLGPLEIRVKIDRLDLLADDSLAIIDYKTGLSLPSKKSWLDERPNDVQLALYAEITNREEEYPLAALVFAQTRSDKTGFKGTAASSAFHSSIKLSADDRELEIEWQDLLTLWQQRLTALAADFTNGDARVDPLPGSCQHCDLTRLCRINERQDAEMSSD